MSGQYLLKKCGVRFDPPAVVITYVVKASGKLHRRTMPLRNFNKNSGVSRVAEELKGNGRHKKYLEGLPLPQLEKLVTLIKDHLNGVTLEESVAKNKTMDTLDPEEDLNKLTDEQLKQKKAIMDMTFEKNRKKPGDPDFQYDVEVDFMEGGDIESYDWDSGSETDF